MLHPLAREILEDLRVNEEKNPHPLIYASLYVLDPSFGVKVSSV